LFVIRLIFSEINEKRIATVCFLIEFKFTAQSFLREEKIPDTMNGEIDLQSG